MSLATDVRKEIDDLVKSDRVVLFMKGTRAAPKCGFSASVVEILDGVIPHYTTVDVLSSPELRDGIKVYSDWPTIPQLYVDGEFVGGADIVREMVQSGELASLLESAGIAEDKKSPLVEGGPPSITFTDAAKQAARDARQGEDGPYLRLEISAKFEHGLSFDVKEADDTVVDLGDGLTVVIDPTSAQRANGLHVDFIERDGQSGFKIDNPNKDKPAAATGKPRLELPTAAPRLTITDAAREQFKGAIEDEEGEGPFGIRIRAQRMGATKVDYTLDVIDAADKDKDALVVEQGGITYWVDPMSARNLDGASIDFVMSGASSGFKFENPITEQGWKDPRAPQLERLLEAEINPGIAAHGGYVQLMDLVGNAAFVHMGGGCQGCGMAGVTLHEGILERVRAEIPSIEHMIDVTDHSAGQNPYYAAR